MTFPWDAPAEPHSISWLLEQNDKNAVWDGPVPDPSGTPAFLRRDANNRAPFMDVVATKQQPQACTEPPLMPWSVDFNKPTG